MHRAGQYLVESSDFLGWFNVLGILAVALMLFMLTKLRANLLNRLSPSVTAESFGLGLGVGGTFGIVLTLLITATSLMFLETVVELTGEDINQERTHAAGIEENLAPKRTQGSPSWLSLINMGRGVSAASKNKVGQVAIGVGVLLLVICIVLLVIGAGYAFTMLKLGFWGNFAAMSAGVALPEEMTKAAAGLLVLYMVFETKSLSQIQFQRAVLAAFAIAGLGFGAGEALKYFGSYAKEDAGVFWYGVRAVWCVTLHGAWTLTVGAMLAMFLPQDSNTLANSKAETFYVLLLASMPMAVIHGLYNACCYQGGAMPWIVGVLSLIVALGVVDAFLDDRQDAEKVEPTDMPAIPLTGGERSIVI